MPPLAPMLAKAAATVPPQPDSGDPTWSYGPKWDGFRAIIFRDGDEVVLGSRGGKDLARYFPEAVETVKSELPEKCVVDGERGGSREIDGVTRLSWEALSERIHPATSTSHCCRNRRPRNLSGSIYWHSGIATSRSRTSGFDVRCSSIASVAGRVATSRQRRPTAPKQWPGSKPSKARVSTGLSPRSWRDRTCRTSAR